MEKLGDADFSGYGALTSPTSRRVFIRGMGLVSTALLMGSFGGCRELEEAIRNRPIRRRLRVGSAEVDADIAVYRQAVEAMMALPPGDSRGWVAQAAIHGISTHFNFCEHGTNHFFDWHRAYLLYFERLCQKYSGNPHFGLPYWNWNQNPDIHPAFLDTTSKLYLARTRTSMSGSSAITTATLDPIFGDPNFFTFMQQLEGTPHNNVHSFTGGVFGGFGSAADPLFWMHHCMVDYCWYKWNADLGNSNTNDSTWINHPDSHFVDEAGNPASVEAGLTPLMPLISYQYESSAIGSHPSVALRRATAEYRQLERRLRAGANVHFDVKHRIHLADQKVASIGRTLSLDMRSSAEDFAQIVNATAANERIFASIEYAHGPARSDFAVRVFVNLPAADAHTPNEDSHYAGSFAFFGTEEPDAAAPGNEHRHPPRFLVDLTRTIRRLKESGELKPGTPLSIQLVPTPFGAAFEREGIELVLTSLDVIVTPVFVNSSPR